MANADYRAEHGASFDRMATPLDDYDLAISPDAKNNERFKAECVWTARLERQRLIRTAECKAHNLIVAAVKDTWSLLLKSATTFYNKVTPRAMLDHLANNCGGLDFINVVALQASMNGW